MGVCNEDFPRSASLQATEWPQVLPLTGCPEELLDRSEGSCFVNYVESLTGDEVPYQI